MRCARPSLPTPAAPLATARAPLPERRGPDRQTILFPTKMKMLLLLLCLGLTLVCVHAEEASSTGRNFNVEKINGEWHTIILASDKREKIEDNGNFRLFLEQIHVLENSLVLKFHTVRDEECSELSMVADKTEKAGEYSVTYDGFNTFTIPKTDYDNFLMAHLINEKDGETFQLMGLYGREPDLSSDIKERFAQLCEEHGILRENIIDLSNANRCLQARE